MYIRSHFGSSPLLLSSFGRTPHTLSLARLRVVGFPSILRWVKAEPFPCALTGVPSLASDRILHDCAVTWAGCAASHQ